MNQKIPGIHGLSFYSAQSLLIHGIFFAMALLFGKLAWDRTQERRAENIQLVQNSVRVDMVAMPELTVQELKTYEEPQKVEEIVAEETKVVAPPPVPDQPEFIEEKKKQDFASMLKNLSKKKVEEKVVKNAKKKEASVFDGKKLDKLVAAGNKLSGGAALVGGEASAAQGEYALYLGSLPEAVRPYWKLPSYLASQELQARVRVFIRTDGSLIKAELYESSGVAEYDQRAIEAVRRARFSPMPKGQSDRGIAGEIVLGFPL